MKNKLKALLTAKKTRKEVNELIQVRNNAINELKNLNKKIA